VAAILLDVDGVLHVSGEPIRGAAEAVARLRESGHRLRFVTNSTTRARAALADDLRGLGVELEDDELQTTAAVAALGDTAPALYYVTMAPGRMRAVIDTVAARIPPKGEPYSILGVSDADAFGAAAAPPTLILDVRACTARKLAALRCHRTQLAGDALDLLSDEEARRLLGVEYFRCANVGSMEDAFIEQLAPIPAERRGLDTDS